MRQLIALPCAGETLIATIDEGAKSTGLLIVSGGNEVRSGAHRGMASVAADLAARGFPVLRYDRRGIGDSTGENRGFLSARDDLIAAATGFRVAAPHVTRLIGFGNCDAATTLALFGRDAGLARILLANPWTTDENDGLPPTAAIRARYVERLRRPSEWRRLLTGGVDFAKLMSGLKKLSASTSRQLEVRAMTAIVGWGENASVILSRGDATAIAYAAAAKRHRIPVRTQMIETDSHSFARTADKDALFAAILAELHR